MTEAFLNEAVTKLGFSEFILAKPTAKRLKEFDYIMDDSTDAMKDIVG